MSGLFNVAKISGIEAIEEVVAGSQVEPTQLAAGQLTGSMAQLIVGRASLSTAQIAGSFRAYGPLSECNCTLGAILDSSGPNTQWDYETQLGDVAVVPAGIEHDARYSEFTHWLAIALPLEDVRRCAEVYELKNDPGFWQRPAMYRSSLRTRELISTMLKRVANSMQATPAVATVTQAAEGLIDDAVEALFLGYRESEIAAVDNRRNFVRATRISKIVDDYLREREWHPVRVTNLCSHLGLSERTLRRAFVEKYGIPPARYLIFRRLSQVRQILTTESNANVTDTAMRCGFWDLSRFARQYKNLFGEAPSMTLRRQRRN
jgi:AraC-like DNA-binding protein